MSADLLDSMLDLMRRLPPRAIEENVSALVQIAPDFADDLLGSVDQPLKLQTCGATGRDYLVCDYNRDGESYRCVVVALGRKVPPNKPLTRRSPWSNEYEPRIDDGTKPSPRLRKLEQAANEAFDLYREMYFEGGTASVYLWDLEHDGGFAGVVLFKKCKCHPRPLLRAHETWTEARMCCVVLALPEDAGSWDSIHVFETSERGRNAHYKLTSTIMLHLCSTSDATGEINLAGSMTRQVRSITDPPCAVSRVSDLITLSDGTRFSALRCRSTRCEYR
jgi:capping protein beta